MKMFLDTSHEDLRLLDEALRGRKTDDALHRVHRLYGAALTVGATSLVSELERFEISMRLALRIPADSQQRLDRLRQNLLDYQRFQLL
jgi:HPt (histidine-containing phosphotransfer) domain-containing protein